MKKILKVTFVLAFLIAFANLTTAAPEDGLYYSDKMVKNGTFTWIVTQNENTNEAVDVYSVLNVGSNFTVQLKDDLYPGPITEEELNSVYATIEIDGEKYTGSGFPLFWHIEKVEDGNITSIRDEFEVETDLFNVSSAGINFLVNFTIFNIFEVDNTNYTLFVELEIDPLEGLTTRYYDELLNGTQVENTFEMEFTGYIVSAPIDTVWIITGLVSISAIVWFVKKKRR
ncbi:MAG: hypothetical protein KAS52_05410 [Candidatus Heimdallarchaeota archaeon]|nr:hypothetical protein [Candidatus Heimdallarchaeota archaeon]